MDAWLYRGEFPARLAASASAVERAIAARPAALVFLDCDTGRVSARLIEGSGLTMRHMTHKFT